MAAARLVSPTVRYMLVRAQWAWMQEWRSNEPPKTSGRPGSVAS